MCCRRFVAFCLRITVAFSAPRESIEEAALLGFGCVTRSWLWVRGIDIRSLRVALRLRLVFALTNGWKISEFWHAARWPADLDRRGWNEICLRHLCPLRCTVFGRGVGAAEGTRLQIGDFDIIRRVPTVGWRRRRSSRRLGWLAGKLFER
jgi:hypothetical protein